MSSWSKRKIIVLEGGDGVDKDTQLSLLREHFGEKGFLYTREPGGTRLGERIRELLMQKDGTEICMEAELLLFSASRAQQVRERIRPTLASGTHVICSRFSLSTIAYQLYGRAMLHYFDAFFHIDQFAVGNTKPNLYVLLDAPATVGLERQNRLGFEKDRIENEALMFRECVRDGYRQVLPPVPYGITINANRSREDVQKELIATIEHCVHDDGFFEEQHHAVSPVLGFSHDSPAPVW